MAKSQKNLGLIMEKIYRKQYWVKLQSTHFSPHGIFSKKTQNNPSSTITKIWKTKVLDLFPYPSTLYTATRQNFNVWLHIHLCVRCCSHCCYSTVLLLGPPATNMRYVPPIFCSSFHLSSFLKLQISKKAMQLKLHIYPYSPPSISCSSLSSPCTTTTATGTQGIQLITRL